jgi:hypothetical protein
MGGGGEWEGKEMEMEKKNEEDIEFGVIECRRNCIKRSFIIRIHRPVQSSQEDKMQQPEKGGNSSIDSGHRK